jgi:hypothetical protein
MTEISLWHAGDEKIRVVHTTEDVDIVSERVRYAIKHDDLFYAKHPTSSGMIYISADLLKSCVVTVCEVSQISTAKVQ